jgi:hypothetical protein
MPCPIGERWETGDLLRKPGERVVGSLQEAIDLAKAKLKELDERAVREKLYPDCLNDGPVETRGRMRGERYMVTLRRYDASVIALGAALMLCAIALLMAVR